MSKKDKIVIDVISLKRLLNHYFLRNWISKMIKKSLENYILPKTRNCTFLKPSSKDGNILPRQSRYSERNFSNRHKIKRNFKKVKLLLCIWSSKPWRWPYGREQQYIEPEADAFKICRILWMKHLWIEERSSRRQVFMILRRCIIKTITAIL